jgi:hypothetical protein
MCPRAPPLSRRENAIEKEGTPGRRGEIPVNRRINLSHLGVNKEIGETIVICHLFDRSWKENVLYGYNFIQAAAA